TRCDPTALTVIASALVVPCACPWSGGTMACVTEKGAAASMRLWSLSRSSAKRCGAPTPAFFNSGHGHPTRMCACVGNNRARPTQEERDPDQRAQLTLSRSRQYRHVIFELTYLPAPPQPCAT